MPYTLWLMSSTGDLAFGASFGMLEAAKDAAPVPVHDDQVMESYGRKDATNLEWSTVPAVAVLNNVIALNFCFGCLPSPWRRLMMKLQSFRPGIWSGKPIGKIAVAAVSKRLSSDVTRRDFLAHLVAARDEQGKPLTQQELTSEATTLIIGGSDTTSTSVS